MIAAVVLAGGASRRFGSDKTRVELDGVSILGRVLDAVRPLVDELVVVGPWAPPGVTHVLEPDRFRGPLAALAFGLHQVSAPHALVLGGDHPLLQPALLEHLLARRGATDAIVPLGTEGPEPLVACYRTGVVEVADRLVGLGRLSARGMLHEVDTDWVAHDDWRDHDPGGLSFLDVDRPEDLEEIRRHLPPQR